MTPGSLMAAEMAEQPRVLRAVAERHDEIVAAVRAVLPAEPAGVHLAARGSSDQAAVSSSSEVVARSRTSRRCVSTTLKRRIDVSQVRSVERPSKPSMPSRAARSASCTASSASAESRSCAVA